MIDGKNRIGNSVSSSGDSTFQAFSPVLNVSLPEQFHNATQTELDGAVNKAKSAQAKYKSLPHTSRASFLRVIAEEIELLGDTLIERCHLETGLPKARLIGERARTTGQLRLFADLVEDGSWVEATIDVADPERKPLPKPDIRKMLFPLGVIGVFTASNFPLAFSTAGGDTASALAAGNAVIVKAHPYHPGTNELVSNAILKAAKQTGMPDGIFSSLNGNDFSIGQALVMHSGISGIAFTGSSKGGRALHDLAHARKDVIPVFAEMGSINPVVLLPEILKKHSHELAHKMMASITMGAGQFCTNPGLMIAMKGEGLDQFEKELVRCFSESSPQLMLHPNIKNGYEENLATVDKCVGVEILTDGGNQTEVKARPVVAKVSGGEFLKQHRLSDEVFGPFSLLVECNGAKELNEVVKSLDGQLTTTVMGTSNDFAGHANLITQLQEISGRVIFNGVPTGVEVGHAMHHGGPYPATTDARFTSVGTDAIKRFVRPVAFQDAPSEYLPEELKDENPLNIWRKVNGKLTRNKIFLSEAV